MHDLLTPGRYSCMSAFEVQPVLHEEGVQWLRSCGAPARHLRQLPVLQDAPPGRSCIRPRNDSETCQKGRCNCDKPTWRSIYKRALRIFEGCASSSRIVDGGCRAWINRRTLQPWPRVLHWRWRSRRHAKRYSSLATGRNERACGQQTLSWRH